jgi:hypothetical protein
MRVLASERVRIFVVLYGPLVVKNEGEYQVKDVKNPNSLLNSLNFALFKGTFFVRIWLEIVAKMFDFLNSTFLL